MLQDNPPAKCPSMNAESLALFLRYKSPVRKGQPLTDLNGNPKLDRMGQPIICDGGWKAEINEKQWSSTITKIHETRGESGIYLAPCDGIFFSSF